MATGTIKKYVNPPDNSTATRVQALTSGADTIHYTSTGGWYQVRAINRDSSGDCRAVMTNYDASEYYATAFAGTGTWIRAVTPWMYIPSGTYVNCRAWFTDSNSSGLYKASEL